MMLDISSMEPGDGQSRAQWVWESEIARIAAIPAGTDLGANRNERLFVAVCTLASYIPPPWCAWTADQIRASVTPLATERQIPGADATIESGIARGAQSPAREDTELAKKVAAQLHDARPWLANYEKTIDADGDEHTVPRSIGSIIDAILQQTDQWPGVCSSQLFAPLGDDIWWLRDVDSLVAWLDRTFVLHWRAASGGHRLATYAQVRAGLLACASRRYSAVETLPHYPPRPDTHYTGRPVRGDGSHLRRFLALLNPASEADRALLCAMLLTPAWGGPAGARPAFVLTSEYGRGAGKTATALAICRVWGGAIHVAQREPWQRTIERLLTDSALTTRCVLMDNVKGRNDTRDMEAAITADRLNGRKMYIGDASRPNTMTWIITANTPALSTDLAQRSVVIQIGPPAHGRDFDGALRELLDGDGAAMLRDDALAMLRAEQVCTPAPDRLAPWQRAVLGRMPHGAELATLIQQRRGDCDDEAEEAAEVAALLDTWAAAHGADHIPTPDVMNILRRVWPDAITHKAVWARLDPLLGNGALAGYTRIKGGRKGRGISLPRKISHRSQNIH